MSERSRAVRQAVNRFAFHRDQHRGWRRAAVWLLLCNALTLAIFGAYVALLRILVHLTAGSDFI